MGHGSWVSGHVPTVHVMGDMDLGSTKMTHFHVIQGCQTIIRHTVNSSSRDYNQKNLVGSLRDLLAVIGSFGLHLSKVDRQRLKRLRRRLTILHLRISILLHLRSLRPINAINNNNNVVDNPFPEQSIHSDLQTNLYTAHHAYASGAALPRSTAFFTEHVTTKRQTSREQSLSGIEEVNLNIKLSKLNKSPLANQLIIT